MNRLSNANGQQELLNSLYVLKAYAEKPKTCKYQSWETVLKSLKLEK